MPDLVYQLLSTTLAALGALLLLWALFWDRARGRRRCPRCWYVMDGVPGLTCPECGRGVRRERELRRTRRSWRWGIVALVLAVCGYVVGQVPTGLRHGWVRVIPSSILVLIAPMGDDAWKAQAFRAGYPRLLIPNDSLLNELLARCKERMLAGWQWQVSVDRILHHQPDQTGWFLVTRDRWPRDVPVWTEVGPLFTLPTGADMVLRFRIRGSNRDWIERSLSRMFRDAGGPADLGTPPPATDHCEIEAEILGNVQVTTDGRSIVARDTSRAARLWRGTLARVDLVDTAAAAMTPLTPGTIEPQSIASQLDPKLNRERDGQVNVVMTQHGTHLGGDRIDWALGVRIEVVHEGRIAASGECLYPMVEPGSICSWGPVRCACPLAWVEPPPSGASLDGSWRIRVIGDPAVAIRDLRRSVYWDGQFEAPALEITRVSPFSY